MGKTKAGIELAWHVIGGEYSRHELGLGQHLVAHKNWRKVVPGAARWLTMGRKWVKPRWAEVGRREANGMLLPKRGADAEEARRGRVR
jgi:hypothetical protein